MSLGTAKQCLFAFMVKKVQVILSDYVSGVKVVQSDSTVKNFFLTGRHG